MPDHDPHVLAESLCRVIWDISVVSCSVDSNPNRSEAVSGALCSILRARHANPVDFFMDLVTPDASNSQVDLFVEQSRPMAE